MARWQRDPKARRNVVYVLVAAEVLAVAANFYAIFSAYLLRLNLRLSAGKEDLLISLPGVSYVAIAATAVCVGVGIFVAVMYARDRAWARGAFIVVNVVLVVLGIVWFAVDRLGTTPELTAVWLGLLLPIVTLFPLLWPLVVFRPVLEGDTGASDAP
jgi:hypothetical protein